MNLTGKFYFSVLDMLRFDKFTGGKSWITEYGDPSKKPDFDVLFKYSPLQNVKIPEDPKLQVRNFIVLIFYTNMDNWTCC